MRWRESFGGTVGETKCDMDSAKARLMVHDPSYQTVELPSGEHVFYSAVDCASQSKPGAILSGEKGADWSSLHTCMQVKSCCSGPAPNLKRPEACCAMRWCAQEP